MKSVETVFPTEFGATLRGVDYPGNYFGRFVESLDIGIKNLFHGSPEN